MIIIFGTVSRIDSPTAALAMWCGTGGRAAARALRRRCRHPADAVAYINSRYPSGFAISCRPRLPPRSASASALIRSMWKAPTSANASGAQCTSSASRRRKHACDMRTCSCAATQCVAFAGAGKLPGRSTQSSRTGSAVPRRSPRQISSCSALSRWRMNSPSCAMTNKHACLLAS